MECYIHVRTWKMDGEGIDQLIEAIDRCTNGWIDGGLDDI